MPLDIGALLFEGVKKVVFTAISKRVVLAGETYLTQKKIERRIDDSIGQVVEQLMPFFENERLSDHKRQVLISNCTHELAEILEEPREVFAASLDGQKMFDRRYENRRLPQGIRDEGLEDLYAGVFPQIANLICAYPPAIEQWKIEGYRDGFRRLDDIAAMLGGIAHKLDQFASKESQTADVRLSRVRQSLAQRVEFQLDLAGLRGERPDAVPLEKCFVVPELVRQVEDRRAGFEKREIRIGNADDIVGTFSRHSLRAMVVGSPGSGKSTWSRWLQREQLIGSKERRRERDKETIAILVRLRDLVRVPTFPSYQNLIRDAAGIHLREEVDADIAREWCSSGVVTFILDGFDEVPPHRRESVISWVKELDSTSEKAAVILTSRPLTTSHLDRLATQWVRWELLPFDERRITDYVTNWYAFAPLLAEKQREIDAKELAEKWIADFALQPLIGVPLMLATIVMVHHMDGDLPRGRSKLYERYVDGMLGLWDSRWGVPASIQLSVELKRRILTALAIHLHMTHTEQLGDDEIKSFMQTVLPNLGCKHSAQEVLDHLRERTGLLIGPGTWSFVHKNVGEFLVATAIQDGDSSTNDGQKLDRLRLFAQRHDDRWNNVLFFWAGLTTPGDLQGFIEQVSSESAAEDPILALSLFYDQLPPYRLTEPWRSKQLLKLLQTGFRSSGSRTIHFMVGPVPKTMSLNVETIFLELRLPEPTIFHLALWECLKGSNVTWKQCWRCHDSVRFIAWMFFATQPPNADELRAALDKRYWMEATTPDLLLFPSMWGVAQAATGTGALSLEEFIEILGESQPGLKPRLPFFLLGALTQRFLTENDPGILSRLLRALESIKDGEVDRAWLKLSGEFKSYSGRQSGSLDLLLGSNRALERIERIEGMDPALVSSVREYLAKLKTMRDRVITAVEPRQKE